MWLRIDSIEQAIRESGVLLRSIDDAGYRVAYGIAEDNLRLGSNVIGDSVNGWSVTRNAWRDTGVRAGAQLIESRNNMFGLQGASPAHRNEGQRSARTHSPGLASGDRPQLRALGSGSPDDRHRGTQHRRLCKARSRCHHRTRISQILWNTSSKVAASLPLSIVIVAPLIVKSFRALQGADALPVGGPHACI
jgi:hypothetical protein